MSQNYLPVLKRIFLDRQKNWIKTNTNHIMRAHINQCSLYWYILRWTALQNNQTFNPHVTLTTLTCYTNSCCAVKELSDSFRTKDSSGSIYLTHKTTPHVSVWNTEDCCHIYENEILPWRHHLIDANASEFSALHCHEMKISQPGEQINSELCHAIFVSHYIWSLFIPAEVSAVCATKLLQVTSPRGFTYAKG